MTPKRTLLPSLYNSTLEAGAAMRSSQSMSDSARPMLRSCRHSPGVLPVARTNVFVRWLWSTKPQATATSASGVFVLRRRSLAFSRRISTSHQCVMTKPKNRLRDQRSVFLGEPIPDHEDTRTGIDIPDVKGPLELYPLRNDPEIGVPRQRDVNTAAVHLGLQTFEVVTEPKECELWLNKMPLDRPGSLLAPAQKFGPHGRRISRRCTDPLTTTDESDPLIPARILLHLRRALLKHDGCLHRRSRPPNLRLGHSDQC